MGFSCARIVDNRGGSAKRKKRQSGWNIARRRKLTAFIDSKRVRVQK
jgi:hypothetical protein